MIATARSVARAAIWRDNDALLRQVDVEAPDNYRARRTLRVTSTARAASMMPRGSTGARSHSGARIPRCTRTSPCSWIARDRTEAVAVLNDGLGVDPAAPTMRSKLYYIRVRQGDWPSARATASAGLAVGDTMFASLLHQADSALAAPAIQPPVRQ